MSLMQVDPAPHIGSDMTIPGYLIDVVVHITGSNLFFFYIDYSVIQYTDIYKREKLINQWTISKRDLFTACYNLNLSCSQHRCREG